MRAHVRDAERADIDEPFQVSLECIEAAVDEDNLALNHVPMLQW